MAPRMEEAQPSTQYTVIARRYRPQRFDQVLGQDPIVATLRNAILHGRIAQAYLFCGTRGTGKTTLARLLARALNCPHRGAHAEPCGSCSSCREIAAGISLDVLEIDGASNRGIDDIRALTETAPYAAAGGGFKIIIIDEVHMLTKEAFNALLKTLEEPPPNLKFIFATTEPHKVPPTILSRCQRFDLHRIPMQLLMQKLSMIAQELGREVRQEAMYLIASQAQGSFRDGESLLDQVLAYQAEGCVEATAAAQALGQAPRELWFQLDQVIGSGDLGQAMLLAKEIFQTGIDLTQALEQCLEHLRCHLLVQLGQLPQAMPGEWIERYRAHAQLFTSEQLLMLLDEVTEAWQEARHHTPSPWNLEYVLMRAARSRTRIPLGEIVQRMVLLERKLQSGTPVSAEAPRASSPAPLPVAPVVKSPPKERPSEKQQEKPPEKPREKEPALVGQAQPEAILSPEPSPTPSLHPSRLETLMRFAAVELEGTLAPPTN